MSKKPEKTATYVVSCTTPKGSEYYRTQRHRWCRPMPGMNDDTWLLLGIIYLTPDNSSGSYLLMQRAIPPQPRGGCYAG